jgi:hypothetical protein
VGHSAPYSFSGTPADAGPITVVVTPQGHAFVIAAEDKKGSSISPGLSPKETKVTYARISLARASHMALCCLQKEEAGKR